MKKFALAIAVFVHLHLCAQQQSALVPDAEGSLVKWMTLQEAVEKVKTQPRPIILDFYTSWCGWCKRMMATTYASPGLAQYINTNFYPVKFDAETKDTVNYLGVKYGPSGDGPKAANSLAVKLLQGKMMYPSTLFLNNYDKQKNEFAFSMVAQGYLDIPKIEPILVYQLENAFRNSGFEDFEKMYNKTFHDTSINAKNKALHWQQPAAFFAGKDSTKKKTLVFIHTEWCNACKVMYRTSFIDSLTEKYLHEKFELVDFNAESMEPVAFHGQTFTNQRSPQMPFHQLAVALCRNSLTLPTIAILDEKLNLLDAVPFYLNPQVLKNIATYYGDDIFKSKSWNDFMASGFRP